MNEKLFGETDGLKDQGFNELLDEYSKQNKENSFEFLLDTYTNGINEDIHMGDPIKGEIISIGQDSVYVDTKTKIDGVVGKSELLDENGVFPYKIGDILELYVVSLKENEILLSKAISSIGGENILKEAFENHIPVEGKIADVCKGGFHVEIFGRMAFCPISQVDLKYVQKPEEYVGSVFRFIIKRVEERGKNIVISRRELLEKELEEEKKKRLEEIKVGTQTEGRVTKLMPYGVFVELFPGIEGMVHISELSWSRVKTPDEIVGVGDLVIVKVLEIAQVEDKPLKISLSIKQASGDPWDSVNEKFHIGDKVAGKVTRCMEFGAFVEISPGIEGLVHISEMSYLKRVLKPEELVTPGDRVSVAIQRIDVDNKRISLSMKEVEGDPWVEGANRFSKGQTVEGAIEKKEKFGYFINLMPGVTGLLPKSKISNSDDPASIEKLKTGDRIAVKVEDINIKDRKIVLDVPGLKGSDDWRQFTKEKETSLGGLGEKLLQALKDKENK